MLRWSDVGQLLHTSVAEQSILSQPGVRVSAHQAWCLPSVLVGGVLKLTVSCTLAWTWYNRMRQVFLHETDIM